MASLGEQEILIRNHQVGQLRVLRIAAAPALYPRLVVDVGCTLNEIQGQLAGYELTELGGELRAADTNLAVGSLLLGGARQRVRASPHAYERTLSMYCDLDHLRLER